VRVAVLPPETTGVKITCAVQLLPLFNMAPQVVVPVAKLAADAPDIWNPTFAIGAPPVLLTVSVSGEPDVPTD
jgi:hypothetical protein